MMWNILITREPKSILLVKLGAIGDVVHALPVLKTLKVNYPSVSISWVVEKIAAPILEGNPYIDDLIIIDTRRWRKNPGRKTIIEMKAFIENLRSRGFDLAIDLQGLLKSGVISKLSGAGRVIGFDFQNLREYANALFTNIKTGPGPGRHHVIDICLSLLNPLKPKTVEHDFFFNIRPEERIRIDRFLKRSRIGKELPLIIVNPAAGWATKEWGVEKYAKLADKIKSRFSCNVVINWGPGEKYMAEHLLELMREEAFLAPLTTLKQSIALLDRADLFIGPDTGPMHIAAGLGVQVVAIFGPSDPVRNGPYGNGNRIVHTRTSCDNCYKRSCSTVRCMELISVDDVFNEAKKCLEPTVNLTLED